MRSALHVPTGSAVLLIGPAASGKSTFAARYFEPSAVINLDRLREQAADDANDMSATPTAVAIQRLLLEARLARGLTTVLDSTNLQPSTRADLLARIRRHQRPAVAVLFQVPLAVCEAANAARRHRRVPAGVIPAQHAQLPTVNRLRDEGFPDVRTVRRDVTQRTVGPVRWQRHTVRIDRAA